TRVAEENLVGERRGDELLGELFLAGNAVEIRGVPELSCLLGERGGELRVGVTEGIDGNAGTEIEIALALGVDEPGALAPFEDDIVAPIGAHDGGRGAGGGGGRCGRLGG